MLAGYHLAGLPDHDIPSALRLIRQIGYRAGAVRLQRGRVDSPPSAVGAAAIAEAAGHGPSEDATSLQLVLDTEGRFLLDDWDAEGPTLMDPAADRRQQRLALLSSAIDTAARLGASLATFSSGVLPAGVDPQAALDRLSEQLAPLLARGAREGVQLAITPRRGAFVASIGDFTRLQQWMGSPAAPLGLAADVGVMLGGGEMPVVDLLARCQGALRLIYLADVRPGIRGDVPLGEGHLDARALCARLQEIGYQGPLIARCDGPPEDSPALAARIYAQLFGDRIPFGGA